MSTLVEPQYRRKLIEAAYSSAVEKLLPGNAIKRVLDRTDSGFSADGHEVRVSGRLIVVAIGKAACPMARAVADVLGTLVDTGIVLTKDGHLSDVPDGFAGYEASHPVPDERGIEATDAILKAVDGLSDRDVVLALMSGGGSALFESPCEGVSLENIQDVTGQLLRAGAPIQDLNAVRSELSEVKGGGFRRAIGPARTISLILSDVLGNDLEVIASGPTIQRHTDPAKALKTLDRYGLLDHVPPSVTAELRAAESAGTTAMSSMDSEDVFAIIGDNVQFVEEVGTYLSRQGLTVHAAWQDREGEAREQAVEWVREALASECDAILGGGELTVTVRGDGVGGRNTEFALAAASFLDQAGYEMSLASLASDGQDGSANAAGAIIDETSAARMRSADVKIEEALETNDSATALDTIGALVSPGPTGTNVNDVYVAIRSSVRNG